MSALHVLYTRVQEGHKLGMYRVYQVKTKFGDLTVLRTVWNNGHPWRLS
jgi:hypothetical protein